MFEWDNTKLKKNQIKYGVSFADTFAVFEDTNAMTLDQIVNGEERHMTIGMNAFGHTYPCRNIHVAW